MIGRLDTFISRMKTLDIAIEISVNYPWVYLDKINGTKVTEKYFANHGYTLAFLPIAYGKDIQFTDLNKLFNLIRKYITDEN